MKAFAIIESFAVVEDGDASLVLAGEVTRNFQKLWTAGVEKKAP